MNKIIAFLLSMILATGVTPAAIAQQYVEKQDIAPSNLLSGLNPGAENGKAKWTASSAPSFSIVTSGANLYDVPGSKSTFSFDASASSQTVTSSSKAAGGYAGKSGVGSCFIKTTATDYKLQVLKNGTMLSESAISSLSEFTKVSVGFTYGVSSDLYSLRIISASNAAALYYDVCSLDVAENSSVSSAQAAFFGSATDQAGCQYSNNTAGSWQDMPQATGTCGVYSYSGGLSASGLSGPQPSFQIANMPAGDYQITVTGVFACANDAATQDCKFSLYDGTNRYDGQGTLDSENGGFGAVPVLSFLVQKGAASTNQVFRIQSYVSTQATINVDGSSGTSTSPLSFKVIRFPSKSEQAQIVNEQPSYGILKSVQSSNIGVTSSSMTVFSDASFAGGTKTYLGSASACSNANDVCIKLGKLKQGVYDVYFNGGIYQDANSQCELELYDGSISIGRVLLAPPNVASVQSSNTGIRGHLKVDSDIYNKEISLRGATNADTCHIFSSATSAFELGVLPTTMSIADLVIKNSVQSPYSGQINMCSGSIASGGASGSSEGSCVSAFSNQGTGVYRINFPSGQFSASPVCVCNVMDTSFNLSCSPFSTSSTQVDIYVGSGGAASNGFPAQFRCTGSKP